MSRAGYVYDKTAGVYEVTVESRISSKRKLMVRCRWALGLLMPWEWRQCRWWKVSRVWRALFSVIVEVVSLRSY